MPYVPTEEQLKLTREQFPTGVITKEDAAARCVNEAIRICKEKLADRKDISADLGANLMSIFALLMSETIRNAAIFQACGVDTSDLANLNTNLIAKASIDKALTLARSLKPTGKN